MRLARWAFLMAGILGLLPAVPLVYAVVFDRQWLLPDMASMGLFFYGVLFQYICWQILYMVLARDPARFRPMMIPAFLSEVVAPLNTAWLYLYGARVWTATAVRFLSLASLFLVAYWVTGRELRRSAA